METTSEKRDIRLILLDLDGTLLNQHHVLSDRNRQALQAAMAQGVSVILATGKTRSSAEGLINTLNLTTPGVYVQGVVIYNGDGTIRYQQTLDAAIVRKIITYTESRGFNAVAYSGSTLYVKVADSIVDHLPSYHEPKPKVVGSLVNLLPATPIHKLLIPAPEKKVKALRWQLEKQFSGQLNFTTTPSYSSLEILPAGASKGKAARVLVKEMGISPQFVMAVGDGENDIDMLQLAGLGVAMGNADPKLKAVAKVVVSSNEADGVAEAIERYVLPPKPIEIAKPVEPVAATSSEAAKPTETSATPETKSESAE